MEQDEKESRDANVVCLQCEKVVNESWSSVKQYKNELIAILEKEEVSNPAEISLLKAAANAFIQKIELEEAEEFNLGMGFEGVPCGKGYASCDDCVLEECDYF